MILHDNLSSGNGYKVRLLLAQLGLSFSRVEYDIARGETRTPEFLERIDPNGRIPVLETDEGEFLAESDAILFYLADGTPFLPDGRLGRARVLRWMFFEQYSHEPNVATPRYWETHGVEMTEERRLALKTKRKLGHDALGVMEGHLRRTTSSSAGATPSRTSPSTPTPTSPTRAASTSPVTLLSGPGSRASRRSRDTCPSREANRGLAIERKRMENQRREHPYHMHDAIQAQPDAFARAVQRNEDATERFAAEAASCRRLFLVGIGTSHHAALVGEHLFRAYGGGIDVRAVHSFDFALYGPELSSEDCVVAVSHRGTKRYTALALRRAREAGCKTALVTGEGDFETDADFVFRTVAQEKSPAHTVSHTTAVAVLALLAGRFGFHRTGSETLDISVLQDEIPAALRAALGTGDEAAGFAREYVDRRKIWLVGGGPSAVTAAEISLKIKETSYLQAEGLPTETMLHGPFQCVEAEDLFVLVAPQGAARERTLEIAGLAREVGSEVLVVDDGVEKVPNATARLTVPAVPEPFSALTCLVPLQLFTYHLALARGTNPDSFRAEDQRFAKADVSGRL